MLTATCMQRGESRAAVMVVQGAAVGPVFARRRCRTEPASSHSERRNSSPATPPYAEQSPGSCPRPRPVPLHQEPGSERSSSRARGAHLACDGPTCSANGGSRAAPRPAARAQRRLRARNKAEEAAPGRAQCRCTKNRSQRGAAAAPEGAPGLRRPHLQRQRGLSRCSAPRCSCPVAPPCAEQSRGSCPGPRPVPLHQEPGSERSSSRARGRTWPATGSSDGPHLQRQWGL